MRKLSVVLVIIISAACTNEGTGGGPSARPSQLAQSTSPSPRPESMSLATISLTRQDRHGPSFTEGSMTFVTFVDDQGERWREAFGDFLDHIRGRLRLPAGTYRVTARQRPCAGTCAEAFDEPSKGRGLDPPYSTCHKVLDIDPGASLALLLSNHEGRRGCSVSVRTLQVP